MRRAEAAVPAAGDEHLSGETQSGLRADGVQVLQGAVVTWEKSAGFSDWFNVGPPFSIAFFVGEDFFYVVSRVWVYSSYNHS